MLTLTLTLALTLTLTSKGGVPLGEVAQGECFGEMSLLAPEPTKTKQFTLTCARRGVLGGDRRGRRLPPLAREVASRQPQHACDRRSAATAQCSEREEHAEYGGSG